MGSLNEQLVQEGLASVTRDIPNKFKKLSELEFEAKTAQVKIWELGGGIDEDDN